MLQYAGVLDKDVDTKMGPTTESSTLQTSDVAALHAHYLQLYPAQGMLYYKETAAAQQAGPQSTIHKWYNATSNTWTWRGDEKYRGKGSVVSHRDPVTHQVVFGRVQYFFKHTYLDATHTFVYVVWFDFPSVDEESQLYMCKPDTHNPIVNPILVMSQLSEPHIVAQDEDESIIFILDFMDRERSIELLGWIESLE